MQAKQHNRMVFSRRENNEGQKKKKKFLRIGSVWKVCYSVVFAIVSQRENNGGQKKKKKNSLNCQCTESPL